MQNINVDLGESYNNTEFKLSASTKIYYFLGINNSVLVNEKGLYSISYYSEQKLWDLQREDNPRYQDIIIDFRPKGVYGSMFNQELLHDAAGNFGSALIKNLTITSWHYHEVKSEPIYPINTGDNIMTGGSFNIANSTTLSANTFYNSEFVNPPLVALMDRERSHKEKILSDKESDIKIALKALDKIKPIIEGLTLYQLEVCLEQIMATVRSHTIITLKEPPTIKYKNY